MGYERKEEVQENENTEDFRKDNKLYPLSFLMSTIRNMSHPTMWLGCLFQGAVNCVQNMRNNDLVIQKRAFVSGYEKSTIYGQESIYRIRSIPWGAGLSIVFF